MRAPAPPGQPGFSRTRSASVTVPAGSTLRFRYLAEGGHWFDDEAAGPAAGQDAVIAV